jgi:hypothetical protein
VLGVAAPVAVGRFLGVPLTAQARASVRPALVTAALFTLALALSPGVPTGSWPALVGGVGVTFAAAGLVALPAGLDARQRSALVGRGKAALRRKGGTP